MLSLIASTQQRFWTEANGITSDKLQQRWINTNVGSHSPDTERKHTHLMILHIWELGNVLKKGKNEAWVYGCVQSECGHQKDETIQYFIGATQINLITSKRKRCMDAFPHLLFLFFSNCRFFFFLARQQKRKENKTHQANGRITTENRFCTK